MRALMLGLVVVVLARCKEKSQIGEPGAQPGETAPATVPPVVESPLEFDPNDGERTLRWIAGQKTAIMSEAKQGNEISYKNALRKFDELQANMKGKSVKWKVKVSAVGEQGVQVQPIEFASLRRKVHQHYSIRFMSEAPQPEEWSPYSGQWPGEIGLFKHNGWANKAATGDAAFLQGTIVEVRGDPKYNPRTWEEGAEQHAMEPFVFKINGTLIQK